MPQSSYFWAMVSDNDGPTELPPLYIRERMANPRVTGEQLAERMGTTPATISRLLNGKRKMTLEWLFAFAKALNTPISGLFSPPSSGSDPESQLRSALLAYGVDRHDLGRAVSSVKVFLDGHDEQSSQDLPDDQSAPSSGRREPVPSR